MVALFAEQSKIIDFPLTAIGQGKSNEWFTPSKYIEAAREVMDGIDLDPASCASANETIKAARYHTKEDNGLTKEWRAQSVWLNPPYGMYLSGQSNMVVWSKRLIDEYKRGNVNQAVLLSMVNTESSWFANFWQFSICFPSPRVMFHRPNGTLDHHLQGSCFVYLGSNNERFAEVFSEFGPVIPANVAIRRQKVQPLSLWEGVN